MISPHLTCRRRHDLRGVSTLEVVIAVSVFLVVSLGLASASVRLAAQAARNEARLSVVDAIDSRLQVLAGSPFDTLISDSFTAPDPCGASGTPDAKASCVRIAGRQLRISYTVGIGADPVSGAGESASYVDLSATAVLPDNTTVRRQLRVPAPSAGWTSDGAVVRIRTTSSATDLPPIALLDAHDDVVVEGVPFVSGSAVIRVAGDACFGDNAPCRVALSVDPASWWTTQGWTLTPATITGDSAELTLTPGSITETTVDIAKVGTARIRVLAQPTGKGPVSGAPEGSVCVWASFNDGAAARSIPYCNSGAGSEGGTWINISAWPGAFGTPVYNFPDGFVVRVTADHPSGNCPAGPLWGFGSAQGAAAGNTFIDADVCTSWTWGHPTLGGLTGEAPQVLPPSGLEVRLGAARPDYDLIWAALDPGGNPVAIPAAGTGITPPWTKPRAAAAAGTCAVDGNPATVCTAPPLLPAPEQEAGAPPACSTNPFCLSVWNLPPRVTSPGAPWTIPVPDTDENRFTIAVTDPDSPTWQFRVTTLPSHGTLTTWAGTPIIAGAWMPHSATYELRYVRDGSFDGLDTMTIEVLDDGGASMSRQIGLYDLPQPWEVLGPSQITLSQGESGRQVRIRVVATTGANMVGVTPTVTGSGVTLSSPSSTNAEGISTFTVGAGAIPAGSYPITVTAGEQSLTIPVSVVPTPTNLTITGLSGGPQGGSGSVAVTVTDATGAPWSGGAVSFEIRRSGSITGRVRPEPGRCVTGTSGSCGATLRVDTGAKAGPYELTARAGGASDTGSFTVTQVASTLSVSGARAVGDRFATSTAAASPAAWFRLDERSGTTAASATGGSPGTFYGSPTLGTAPLVAGGDSAAAGFDGLDDRMCAPGVTLGSTASLEVWARFTGFTSDPAQPAQIWGRADDGTSAFALVLGGGSTPGSDRLRLIARIGGTLYSVAAPAPLSAGRTYHLVGTYDGTALRLYVDGTTVGVTAASGVLEASGTWCAAGVSLSSEHVTAVLDEPAAYPYAMSSARTAGRTTLGRVTAAGGGWVTIDQGGSVEVPLTVTDAAGDPVAGQTVTVTVNETWLTVPTPTFTTGPDGSATFTVDAALNAPAGSGSGNEIEVNAAGVTANLNVEISPVPVSLSVSDITVSAGGRASWPVTILDGAGVPLPGRTVTVTPVGDANGLRISGSATSDGTGQARPWVGATPSVTPATYDVVFASGAATATASVSITPAPSKVETVDGPFRLPQGSSGQWRLKVTDTSGAPISGVDVSVGCEGCGLAFDSGTTDSSGSVTITVTDIGGPNPEGSYDVVVSVGGYARAARVTVRAAVSSLTSSGTLRTAAGTSVSGSVTALDSGGVAVPGVDVTGSAPSGITVAGSRTDGRGRSVITARVPSTTPAGTWPITVTADGVSVTIDVEVTP